MGTRKAGFFFTGWANNNLSSLAVYLLRQRDNQPSFLLFCPFGTLVFPLLSYYNRANFNRLGNPSLFLFFLSCPMAFLFCFRDLYF